MPKSPSLVVFTCQACGRASKTDARKSAHLLPWLRKLPIDAEGASRSCGGEWWMLTVAFIETDVNVTKSFVGAGLAATVGVGISSTETCINQADYPDVPAAVVARLNEDPRQRLARIATFTQLMERERLKEQGGRDCPTCGALFVPNASQPWGRSGYCSKVCHTRAGGIFHQEVETSERQSPAAQSDALAVQCPAGHTFQVKKMFAGMHRACPQCGVKTPVAP